MPSIFAPQTPVTNDTGAVALGFQGAPNVLYDRTMVGNTTYTISTAGTAGGETMSVTLRGAYAYSFASSVAINWAGGVAPTPECSASAFDRIRVEVLQDGSLLGTVQAMGAAAPVPAPVHYLNVSGSGKNALAPASSANDGYDSFLRIDIWLGLASTYVPGEQQDLVARWNAANVNSSSSIYNYVILSSGELFLQYLDASGNYKQFNSSTAISASLFSAAGIWLRMDYNAGTNTIKGVPPGTAVFYTSPGGTTPQWTELGTPVSCDQTGFIHPGSATAPITFGSMSDAGYMTKFYEVIVQNSTTVLANPNFQAQPTMASGGSFVDTALVPNTITLNTNIV